MLCTRLYLKWVKRISFLIRFGSRYIRAMFLIGIDIMILEIKTKDIIITTKNYNCLVFAFYHLNFEQKLFCLMAS